MTKLEQLIVQLCPDGVEYKTLGDISTITRGGSFQKKDFTDYGVPCIHYGQIYTRYGLFAERTLTCIPEKTAQKQRFAQPNDIVMAVTSENVEDVCKCVTWLGDEPVAVSGHSAIIHHNQNPKFLAYYFHSSMFFSQKRKLAQGTKVIEVSPDKLNRVKVPVPPLDVQAEIVRILDKFTEHTTELTTELANRKKQYEFYKELCFDVDTSIERVPTKDITNDRFWLMPATPKYIDKGVPYITSKNINKGLIDFSNVKYISVEDYAEISKNRKIMTNDLLITMIGTIGETAFVGEDTEFYGQNIYLIRIDETKCLRRYYYHYISSSSVKNSLVSKKNASSQGYIKAGSIDNLMIPLPAIEEQRRIVDILDRFDKLCNDISEGLPAEIEARQKQYEYYRDKLLTFTMKE